LDLSGNGASGHYCVLESVTKDQLAIYDPQNGFRHQMSSKEFMKKWSGIALAFTDKEHYPGTRLIANETQQIFGGCDEGPGPERGEGNFGNDCGNMRSDSGSCAGPSCGQGAPIWSVNMVNFNLYIKDIPLWYKPPIGPSLNIMLSYNSEGPIVSGSPFGNKWQFNFGGFLEIDSGSGNTTVVRSDGRRDVYTPDGSGGYVRPYEVYNTLVKITDNHYELQSPYGTVHVYQIPADTSLANPYLVEIKNPHGQSLTFGYNSNGELKTITDALGRDTDLIYINGKVARIEDPFGRFVEFDYENNNLTRITDMGGYTTVLRYDINSYISEIENDRGITGFKIEPSDNTPLKNTSDYPPPDGEMSSNYRITVTDALGQKSEYYYNSNFETGWYVSPRDYIEYVDENTNNYASNVPRTFYRYTETVKSIREEIATIIYPEDRIVSYAIDPDTGQRLSESDYYGNTTNYTYNDMGRITEIKTPIGATKNIKKIFRYDENNHVDLKEIEHTNLGIIYMQYNDKHQVTRIEDQVGRVTEITNDGFGRIDTLKEFYQGDYIITDYAYYAGDHSIESYRYLLREITRDGKVIAAYTYDDKGRVEDSTDAAGVILNYEYNDLDHVTKINYRVDLQTINNLIQYNYSGCCPRLIDSMTERPGRTTYFSYDALERLSETVNPEGGRTRYKYDANNNLTKLIDPKGNETSFKYDLENRLVKKTYADGKSISYKYDKIR
jgi:YD repeat-containing protein